MSLAKQAAASAQTKRRRIQIDEVNVAQNVVTGKDQYGLTFQITYGPWHEGALVTVPKQGENWIIEQYRQEWRLKYKVEDLSDIVDSLAPGDKYLNSGTFWINGNVNLTAGTLTINDPVNPTDAATKNYVDTHAGGGGAVDSVFGRAGIVTAQTGDYTVSQVTGAAPLASPSFTGTPAAPTPATGDNSTTVATTAFVKNQNYVTATTAPVTSVAGKTGAVTLTATDISSSNVTKVTQTTHGFTVGQVLMYNGTAYALAKADTADNAEVVGIVSTVIDANNFALMQIGQVTGLSGLTAGTTYFLSDTTAGALTATQPTTNGHVSKPLGVAVSTTVLYFINMRGETLSPYPTNPNVITSTFSAGPPSSPSDGDIWIATGVMGSGGSTPDGTRWQFQYNAGSTSANKWEFIGGPPLVLQGSGTHTITNGSWTVVSFTPTYTVVRGGDYAVAGAGAYGQYTTSIVNSTVEFALGKNGAAINTLGARSLSAPPSTFDFQIAGVPTIGPTTLAASDVLSIMDWANSAGYTLSNVGVSIFPKRIS